MRLVGSLIALMLLGCSSEGYVNPPAISLPGVVFSRDSAGGAFFPSNAFSDSQVTSYRETLRAMREPALFSARIPSGITIWRFLWLRPGSAPVAVRVTHVAGHCYVTTTMLEGSANSRPRGGIQVRDSIQTTSTDCVSLGGRINNASFWSASNDLNPRGADDADWMFEAITPIRYHAMSRSSPPSEESAAMYELGMEFLRIGRLVAPRRELF